MRSGQPFLNSDGNHEDDTKRGCMGKSSWLFGDSFRGVEAFDNEWNKVVEAGL